MAGEHRVWVRPWGFAPEDVAVPVTVWQGDADHLVPPAGGTQLARRIPGARLVAVAGAGRFVGYARGRRPR